MILLDIPERPVFFQHILNFDYWLFHKINQQWSNSYFDNILPFLRQSELWIPLYLFLLVFSTINFGIKGLWWIVTFAMTAVVGDLFSSHLIKEFVFRFRPCQDPSMTDQVRVLVNYCPTSSSFTSSHACNHFALAVFIFFTLRQTGKWVWLAFLWAFCISYAQVYVGVHYPLDVLCGALLGCTIGYGMQAFFRYQFGSLSLK